MARSCGLALANSDATALQNTVIPCTRSCNLTIRPTGWKAIGGNAMPTKERRALAA